MKRIGKLLIILSLLISLTGCGSASLSSNDKISNSIKQSYNGEVASFTNLNKKFYSLYYGGEIGRIDSNMISNIFSYDQIKFIMMVNVNDILKARFYQDEESDSDTDNYESSISESENVSVYKGQFSDYGNEIIDFLIEIAEIKDNKVYLRFTTHYLTFSSILDENSVPLILPKMVEIAQTTRVHYDEIVNYFGNVETLQQQYASTEAIFEQNFPEEGYLGDLIKKDDETFEFGSADTDSDGSVLGEDDE